MKPSGATAVSAAPGHSEMREMQTTLGERREALKCRLRRYRYLESERRQIKSQIEKVEAMMGPRAANIGGSGGHGGDPMMEIVSQHIALQDRYRKKLQELAAEQNAVENMIAGLEPVARMLMRYRYIDGMTWEEVCVAIGYSWSRAHALHADALNDLLAKGVTYAGAS